MSRAVALPIRQAFEDMTLEWTCSRTFNKKHLTLTRIVPLVNRQVMPASQGVLRELFLNRYDGIHAQIRYTREDLGIEEFNLPVAGVIPED